MSAEVKKKNHKDKPRRFKSKQTQTETPVQKTKLKGHAFAVRLLTDTFVCAWVRAASDSGLLQVFVCKTLFDEIPNIEKMTDHFKKSNCISMFLRSDERQLDRWTDLGLFKPSKAWKIPNTVGWQFADKKPRLFKFSESLKVISKKIISKKEAAAFPNFVVRDLEDLPNLATLYFDDRFPEELGLMYRF